MTILGSSSQQLVPAERTLSESQIEILASKVRKIAQQKMAAADIQDQDSIRALFVAEAEKVWAEYSRQLQEQGYEVPQDTERSAILVDIVDYATGQRVINYIQKLRGISDVYLNGIKSTIVVYRNGQKELRPPLFNNLEKMNNWLTNLRTSIGMHDAPFDPHHPSFDARLPSGIRVNATHTANTTYAVSFRIPNRELSNLQDLYANGTINQELKSFLIACIDAKLNIMIAGGTGAGKTALLLCMLGHLPPLERVVTIEDSVELDVDVVHPHLDVPELEEIKNNSDGVGSVTSKQLLKNSLRMNPDRIVVGEVRNEIARDLLQAMSSGNDGTLSTIHAGSPQSIMDRLVDCSGQSPQRVHESVRNSVDLFIHISLSVSGERRITEIAQVSGQRGPEGNVVLEPIYAGGGAVNKGDLQQPQYVASPSGQVLAKLKEAGWRR